MSAQQLLEIKQRLQQKQIQFYNYRMQSKQMYDIIQQQSNKKQQQIRQLKQQEIKKQKQFKLIKSQLTLLQAQNNNLKLQVQQMGRKNNDGDGKNMEINHGNGVQKGKDQQYKNRISALQQQITSLQTKLKSQQSKHSQSIKQISQLTNQLTLKTTRIKKLQQQIQTLKTYKQSNPQPKQPKQTKDLQNSTKKSKIIQIKIQKTKQIPTYIHNQQINKYKQMYQIKQSQLVIMQQRINKLLQKIVIYQKRIRQLQHQITQPYNHYQNNHNKITPNPKLVIKQQHQHQHQNQHQHQHHYQHQQLQLQLNNKAGKQQQTYHQHRPTSQKTTISVLILTKSFYKSPFLQIQYKNTIKLYKTDKIGKIDKSLGCFKYKLDFISYHTQQIQTITLDNIYKNIENNINSRIILYGIKKSNKKLILYQIINKLRKQIINLITNLQEQYSYQHQHQYGRQGINMGVLYGEYQNNFHKNVEMVGQSKQQILSILNNFYTWVQQLPKTPKKRQKQYNLTIPSLNSPYTNKSTYITNTNIVRYFHFYINNLHIQLITSNFKQPQFPQSNFSQFEILDKLIYSKIPHFNINMNTNIQILLIINPIVGVYQGCKQTLKIVNCKKHKDQDRNINIYDWRQSPNKNLLTKISQIHNKNQPDYQLQTIRLSKSIQIVQFYKTKLQQLLIKLKIMINTNTQFSYLKKSQTVLNYQKIVRFIQAILNQGVNQISTPNKKSIVLERLHDLEHSP